MSHEQTNDQAIQVPMIELLRSVPKDWREMRKIGDCCHRNVPYGHMLHEASDALESLHNQLTRLRSENEALKADRERLDWLEQNNWGVATRSNREYQVKHDKLDFAAPTAPEIRVAIDMARSEGEKTT